MVLDEETSFGEWLKWYRSEHGGRGPHCGDAWIAGRESIRNGIVTLAQEREEFKARAEDAEAKLRAWETAAANNDPYVTNGGYVEVEVLEAVKRRNAELLTRPVTWIPVAERLPDTMLRVLAVYVKDGATTTIRALHVAAHEAICWGFDFDEAVYDAEEDKYYYPEGWYEAMEDGEFAFIGPVDGTVTHWAQLPALPIPKRDADSALSTGTGVTSGGNAHEPIKSAMLP